LGYHLASSLSFSFDLGYLSLRERLSGRSTRKTHPTGDVGDGTADDLLRVRGVMVGASAGLEQTNRMPLQFRIGLGALLAAVASDHLFFRGKAPAYAIEAIRSDDTAFLYVAPEVRLGFHVGTHIELDAGVTALLLLSLSPSRAGLQDLSSGTAPPFFVVVEPQTLAGNAMLGVAPRIGARYEF
jgi:hypothetical protein